MLNSAKFITDSFYAIVFWNFRIETVTKDGKVWIILETDSKTLELRTFKGYLLFVEKKVFVVIVEKNKLLH